MNIKDMYLHGGSSIMKNISFAIASSGDNNGKLVATITWAKEDASTTQLAIPLNGASFGSQTKNYVLAAPSAANGNPTFRALVADDIPNLGAGKITSGEFAAARLPLATNSAKGAVILGVAKTSDADSAITDKKYWVKMNANGKLFVDIPWTDHTYTVNNATFSIKSKIGTNDAVTLSDFTANQSAADDFTLIQGSNITFTNDATNRTLTIAGTPNTTYKLTLNGTVKGTTGGTDLGTFYAIATSDTSTANQVWMRNSSNNGYGWRTLGSRAFDSTAYLPLTGGTISHADFAPFFIQRNHTANAAAIGFKHYSSGTTVEVMGYIGMSEKDGALKRWDGAINTAYTILDSSNSSVSLSGSTLTVKINGTSQSLTNTWRGIQDNLTSSSNTTESLSAKQGYLLANGSARDNTKVLLDSGTAKQTIKSSASSLGIGVIQLWRANTGYSMIGFANGTTKTNLGLIGFSAANTPIFRNTSGTDYTLYHSGNIPSNSASAKGVVPAGVASSVYMTDASKNPSWTSIDTTVTSGSAHLVTSGAVHTAIVNNVAGAVQYLGTVASETAMKGLSNAGFGDFARVTTAFTFTDASGASVTAHVGDIVYLTSSAASAYATSANWIVAHTEIDTNTWTAASTSAAGYVPKLATGGANLAAASTDYVLAFTNGATSPSWLKLPANAYKNDNTTGVKLAAVSGTKKTDSTLIKIGSGTGLSIAGGTNKFSIGDGTNYIEVSVAHGLSTQNMSINGTNYALYTSASSLPTIKAPTELGTANQILATNADATGLTWVDKPATNVTTSLYVGASDGTATAAQIAGNVYLILKEGSTYTRYNITGSGRASVTSDANGKITINSEGYSNFVKSGSGAAAGLVPAPSTTAGTGKFLCEDGTWKTPSYTTNTDENVKQSETTTASYRGIVLGYNSNVTANTGVSGTVTKQVYVSNNLTVQPSTGNVISLGRGTFAGLTSSNGDLIFNTLNHILWNGGSYHQRIFLTDDTTADTAVFTFQQSSDSGSSWTNLMTIRDNGKVVATTFVGALSGNATTASNLQTTSRGFLYVNANNTVSYSGYGTRDTSKIGIPYVHHTSTSNDTYVLAEDLFYKSGDNKYIGNNIRSNKFACIKSKDSITDDWDGSSTSGSSGSGSTTYSAGDGISINNGTISTTKKEWFGTEAQFNSLASLDSNTTYYIMD